MKLTPNLDEFRVDSLSGVEPLEGKMLVIIECFDLEDYAVRACTKLADHPIG